MRLSHRLRPRAAVPLLVACVTACLAACKTAPGEASKPPSFNTMEGKPMYVALCAPCHGPEGKGYAADNAPSLVNPTFLESASDGFLRIAIAGGRPGTSMGAYGSKYGGPLDDEAIDRLLAHLRKGGPKRITPPAGGAGDAARGEPLYAAMCKSCHGDAATRGEGVHLANPHFLTHATPAFIRHAIVRGRPGTKMEAFATKLTDAQIDDVVAYVRTLGANSTIPGQLPPPTGKEPLVLNPDGKDPSFEIRDDRFVGVDQVNQALAAKRRMVIIDARPPSEWMRVHIPGAVSIPYHEMKRLDDMPKDVWAIAYCACPHHLSGDVVDELRRRGHKRALILDEGINEWHRRGYPVVAAKGVNRPAQEPKAPTAPPARP